MNAGWEAHRLGCGNDMTCRKSVMKIPCRRSFSRTRERRRLARDFVITHRDISPSLARPANSLRQPSRSSRIPDFTYIPWGTPVVERLVGHAFQIVFRPPPEQELRLGVVEPGRAERRLDVDRWIAARGV